MKNKKHEITRPLLAAFTATVFAELLKPSYAIASSPPSSNETITSLQPGLAAQPIYYSVRQFDKVSEETVSEESVLTLDERVEVAVPLEYLRDAISAVNIAVDTVEAKATPELELVAVTSEESAEVVTKPDNASKDAKNNTNTASHTESQDVLTTAGNTEAQDSLVTNKTEGTTGGGAGGALAGLAGAGVAGGVAAGGSTAGAASAGAAAIAGAPVSAAPVLASPASTEPFQLSSIDGSNGFVLNGVDEGDYAGGDVLLAGDINGDGIGDIIISSTVVDNYQGVTYVVYGSNDGLGASLDLENLNGENGFIIIGDSPGDYSGKAISTADINNDGLEDLIITAYKADNLRGETYVVFGQSSFGDNVLLSDLSKGEVDQGIVLTGITPSPSGGAGYATGNSVGGLSDINGDGIDDLVIGAELSSPNGAQSGQSFVFFGQSSDLQNMNLSDLNGVNGFVVNGESAGDQVGHSVSSAGDVNGDNVNDFIISAYRANNDEGKAYVLYGKLDGFADTQGVIELSSLSAEDGFVIYGTSGSLAGAVVSSAGDLNSDGYDDLIIGAPTGNDLSPGQVHVVFGQAEFTDGVALADLDGSNGFSITGESSGKIGAVGSAAGDVNGDGYDDIAVSSYMNGSTYVLYGKSDGSPFQATIELADLSADDGYVLQGLVDDEAGISISGGQDVNGDGLDDLIIGAPAASPNSGNMAGSSYLVYSNSKVALYVDEGTVTVVDLTTEDDNDAENGGLVYSIGGIDEANFLINPDTGELSFKSAPNFDDPMDEGSGNDYEITVTVTDSDGLSDMLELIIFVQDAVA